MYQMFTGKDTSTHNATEGSWNKEVGLITQWAQMRTPSALGCLKRSPLSQEAEISEHHLRRWLKPKSIINSRK